MRTITSAFSSVRQFEMLGLVMPLARIVFSVDWPGLKIETWWAFEWAFEWELGEGDGWVCFWECEDVVVVGLVKWNEGKTKSQGSVRLVAILR